MSLDLAAELHSIFSFGGVVIKSQSQVLMTLKKKSFETLVGKEENAGNERFFLFPQCFLHSYRQLP